MSYPAQLWENFLYSNIQQHICQLRAKRIQALTKWRIPEKCQVNELNSFPDDIFWVTVPVYWELAAGVHRKEDTLLHTWPPLLCIFPECLQITTYYGQNTWINKSFCQFSYLEYSSSFPRMSFLPWCVCLDLSEAGCSHRKPHLEKNKCNGAIYLGSRSHLSFSRVTDGNLSQFKQ